MRYGLPYKGSKSQIAEWLIRTLPSGKRLVDLFGGGGAVTHCASLSRKWESVLYNEKNPIVCDCFNKAVHGAYKNETRWISRETFEKEKNIDGYISLVWSFGNNGRNYLYSKEIEPWKKALHYARVFKDTSLFEKMGINTDGSRKDIKAHHKEYREKYIKWLGSEVNNRLWELESLERLQSLESLERLEITCGDYRDYEYEEGDIVYCDPPYADTSGYNIAFNIEEFYEWVRTRPYRIFFSSYTIDEGFYVVDSIVKHQTLNGLGSGKLVDEVLYCNQPFDNVKQLELF